MRAIREDPTEPAHGPEPALDPSVDTSEADLAVIHAAQCDPRAFEPLYERHFLAVYRYCFRRLNDREAAADATSQTFIRALAGVQGFRSGSVGAWLMTIARNVVIDAARARRPAVALDGTFDLPDRGPLLIDQLVASDEQRQLREAIAHLTETQRDIVELRWAGLTGPEIAVTLGISHRAVRSGQHRAYVRLRELLDRSQFFGEAP